MPHVGLAAEQLAGQLADGVGHEGAGDLRLELAVGAVVEHRAGRLDGGGGVGEVVAEHLVLVGPAAGLEGAGAGVDDRRASSTASAAAVRSAAAMAARLVTASEPSRNPADRHATVRSTDTEPDGLTTAVGSTA